MSSLVILLQFLAFMDAMLQNGWTQTYGMPDTWFVNENSQKIVSPGATRKETTQCTCTCEIQDGQTKKLSDRKPDVDSSHWNEVDGGSKGQPDEWSSDGQSPSEQSGPTVDQSERVSSADESRTNSNGNENNVDGTTDLLDSPDRYKGYTWGHGSRFLWRSLKDVMCIRQPCQLDSDCCLRWNICDKSAKVCTNCWYGHPCTSERDCCHDFPYCQRKWNKDDNGQLTTVESGRCVDHR